VDLVHSWRLFRSYYLEPSECRWYKQGKHIPSPPMHYQIPYDLGSWSMNAWAAPRSFAKSTVMRELALLLLLSRPGFGVGLIQATEKKAKKSMGLLRRQLTYNPRIEADFTPLFRARIKPPRGERAWSNEILELPFGSVIEGLSVNGALRGERPDLLLVDDPEYDDEDDGSDSSRKIKLIEDFEKLLFKVLLGMLDDGTAIFWIGTLISRQSFLYHVCRGKDERFQYWNRRVLSVVDESNNLLWKEKWSEQAIRDRRAKLGESAFNSEMMNNPGSGSEKILVVHPDLCTYRVEGEEPAKAADPLQSDSVLVYREGLKDGESLTTMETRQRYGEFVKGLYRMMTVDYAPTQKASSDFSCVEVMGFDRTDTLWMLDIFLGKVRDDALIRIIWELANRWKVKVIGVEAVSIQKHLADRVASFMSKTADYATEEESRIYRPKVLPIRYPNKLSKAERIAGLEWRFNQFRVRLPTYRNEPAIQQLIYQIENFTPDLSMLRWDDAIDTMAMQQYVLKRHGAAHKTRGENVRTPLDLLKSGELYDEKTGIPVISGMNASEIPIETIRELMWRKRNSEEEATEIPGTNYWNRKTGTFGWN